MSEFSLILVLQNKTSKTRYDMAKVQIKSEKLTLFGGIFLGHGAIWLHIVFCNRLDGTGAKHSLHTLSKGALQTVLQDTLS